MAQHDVTASVTEAIAAGATAAQFEELGAENLTARYPNSPDEWIVWNRREEAAVERLHAEVMAAATAAPVAESTEPLATEKQIAFIMRLIDQGRADEGGFITGPTDRAGVARMTRRQASAYIDSLTGSY